MDKMSIIIAKTAFPKSSQNHAQEGDLDDLAIGVVNRLFIIFDTICPGFGKQFRENPIKFKNIKIQFARAFMDEGINRIEQIELGIKRCRRESPVNIPRIGEFLNWCTPTVEDLGLLSKEDAYHRSAEIMRGIVPEGMSTDQVNIILHAIRQSDRHFLRTNPMSKTQPVFYRNYDIAVKQFMAGQFSEIPKAIESQSIPPTTIELNVRGYKANMAALKNMLGMGY